MTHLSYIINAEHKSCKAVDHYSHCVRSIIEPLASTDWEQNAKKDNDQCETKDLITGDMWTVSSGEFKSINGCRVIESCPIQMKRLFAVVEFAWWMIIQSCLVHKLWYKHDKNMDYGWDSSQKYTTESMDFNMCISDTACYDPSWCDLDKYVWNTRQCCVEHEVLSNDQCSSCECPDVVGDSHAPFLVV